LVRLNLENEYPRAYVTTKLGRLGGKSLYYGPFRSRATAENFLNDSLDQFKMRRCTFDLNPDPKFPGCVYSEMKMCLAPCFKGCTDEQYEAEVGRVQAYFDSGGQSLIQEMEAERERLSGALDFENAAHQHTRIAKVKSLLFAWDELCGRVDRLDAVIFQPSAIVQPKSVALFRFRQGELEGPYQLAIEAEGEDESQSLEQRIRAVVNEFVPAGARSATQFMEELAIVKRWHHRSHKVGELVVSRPDGTWPLRRLANAAIRVGRGEKQPDVAAETRS
jgi:excinuclease UvrABC nuclease subunit